MRLFSSFNGGHMRGFQEYCQGVLFRHPLIRRIAKELTIQYNKPPSGSKVSDSWINSILEITECPASSTLAGFTSRCSTPAEWMYLGWHYLSNATCPMWPCLFYALFTVSRILDHHKSLHYSPLLKKPSVRQVVLDKWFPLSAPGRRPRPPGCDGRSAPRMARRTPAAGRGSGLKSAQVRADHDRAYC